MVIGWISALVEHAEDEVDDDERRGDQDRLARQRRSERLGVALKAGLRARAACRDRVRSLPDGANRLAERDARRRLNEIVTEGNCP